MDFLYSNVEVERLQGSNRTDSCLTRKSELASSCSTHGMKETSPLLSCLKKSKKRSRAFSTTGSRNREDGQKTSDLMGIFLKDLTEDRKFTIQDDNHGSLRKKDSFSFKKGVQNLLDSPLKKKTTRWDSCCKSDASPKLKKPTLNIEDFKASLCEEFSKGLVFRHENLPNDHLPRLPKRTTFEDAEVQEKTILKSDISASHSSSEILIRALELSL